MIIMAQAPFIPGRGARAAGPGPSQYPQYPYNQHYQHQQQHNQQHQQHQHQHHQHQHNQHPPYQQSTHNTPHQQSTRPAPGMLGESRTPAPYHSSGGKSNQQTSVQNDFRKLDLVGRGAYGAVYRGVHVATGKAVALKVVNLDTPDDDVSEIQREVALLSQLRETTTKNVIKYWGCWLLGAELWIVMDFAEGGSVRTVMNAGPIAEKHAAVIVRESLVALSYLHKIGIIHRDIKAANILLTNAGDVLLCDFGVAATFVSSSVHSRRTTFVGTPYWMAPEVITQGKSYDQSADIWSLGITIYEMCTGNPPYADQEQMRAIMMIPKNKPSRLPADGPFSQLLREFVALCLNEEPRERPTADELSKTKFIKSNVKVPNSTLRDLINAYTAWAKTGGMRMSLLGAEASDLNGTANRESFAFDGHETSEGWEFSSNSFEDFSAEHEQVGPSVPLRDHPLLRLFDQNDDDAQMSQAPGRGPFTAGSGQAQQNATQYKGAEVRPAPAPPGPAPERPPASAIASSAGVQPSRSLAEDDTADLVKDETSRANPGQTIPNSASAALDNKKAFTGTGATPFRFGGGGGILPASSPPLEEQHFDGPTLRGQGHSTATGGGQSIDIDAHGRNDSQGGGSSDGFQRRRDAHKRQGSVMSSRTSSVNADAAAAVAGSALGRHYHAKSNSVSVYSHSPSASESGLGMSTLPAARLPASISDNHSRSTGNLTHMAPSQSTDVMPSDSFASGLQIRGQNANTGNSRGNGAPAPSTFFDGQYISSSPASEVLKLAAAPTITSTAAAAAASAMPPPPQPGLSGRPFGVGMRSRSGSRSRPWQSASESEAAANEFAGLPPIPRRGALAKYLGVSTNPQSTSVDGQHAPSPATSTIPLEASLLGSPAALHRRRQHGGSDPTQLVARRHSRDGPERSGHTTHGAQQNKGPVYGTSIDQASVTDSPANGLLSLPGGHVPPLQGINIGTLSNKDEVYLELDRTVESLGRWLDVVGSGLARVVGSA